MFFQKVYFPSTRDYDFLALFGEKYAQIRTLNLDFGIFLLPTFEMLFLFQQPSLWHKEEYPRLPYTNPIINNL